MARRNDPVVRFSEWLIEQEHATEDELKAIDAQAVHDVEQAWEFADNSAYPDIDELYTDVFAPTTVK